MIGKHAMSLLAATILCYACGNSSQQDEAITNTDTGVAQAFIRATLDNKVEQATELMIKDSTNLQLMDVFKTSITKMGADKIKLHKEAMIIVNELIPVVNDSLTIFNYSLSYEKDKKSKLKMVRVNGQWRVDFKYTFSGNL